MEKKLDATGKGMDLLQALFLGAPESIADCQVSSKVLCSISCSSYCEDSYGGETSSLEDVLGRMVSCLSVESNPTLYAPQVMVDELSGDDMDEDQLVDQDVVHSFDGLLNSLSLNLD